MVLTDQSVLVVLAVLGMTVALLARQVVRHWFGRDLLGRRTRGTR